MLRPLRTDLGLLVLRAMAGTILVLHGSQEPFGAFGRHGVEGTARWMESIGLPFPAVEFGAS